MSTLPRLYVSEPLVLEEAVSLSANQANYLLRVLRRKSGDQVLLFNGEHGEWVARLQVQGKTGQCVPERQTRQQIKGPDLHLLFAPLKKSRMDFAVEKATELGVRAIQPVLTGFTQSQRVRPDRLRLIAIEAAEQTERLDIPDILEPQPLTSLLAKWDQDHLIYFADEAGDARPLAEETAAKPGAPASILIGPEGGFSEKERVFLRQHPAIRPITLGPRILRAETAIVSALTLWQSVFGDWRERPYVPSQEQVPTEETG